MIIRHELPGDEKTIGRVTHLAFEGHPYSQGTEAAIIRDLRAAGALSLSLVCEAGGDILGHLALSPVRINDAETNWSGLGPISVLPELQGQGIGSALMRAAIAWMKDADAGGCVLVGEPAYYRRFGFAPREALVLPDIPADYFMALPLSGPVPSGIVSFHPAFMTKDTAEA